VFAELLQAARSERSPARGEILDRLRNFLRIHARIAINPALASKADPSDIVQETLLRADERFDQFKGATEQEFAAWVRRILCRNLADLERTYFGPHRRVGRERSLERSLEDSTALLAAGLASAVDTPGDQLVAREQGAQLDEVLAQLPDDYREVIILRNLEELSWEEVGARMERSPGAARKLWVRALRSVRSHIGSSGG